MNDNSIHITENGLVLFNSSSEIAGFQFEVLGGNILSASGGNAETANFTISSSSATLIAFSISGATFSGCGIMIELDLDLDSNNTVNLEYITVSDPEGNNLFFIIENNEIKWREYGCKDMDACNYNSDATIDDGSCAYEIDCSGRCGGNALLDHCGVCNGDGRSCD